MKNVKLFTSVAVAALIAGAPAAFAQAEQEAKIADGGNVNQTTSNDQRVNNSGSVTVGNISGRGASEFTSATGALSAVSGTFVNTVTDIDVGNVNQNTDQFPANEPDTTEPDTTPEIGNSAGVSLNNITGNGASASTSTTAAVSSVSATFVNAGGSVSIDSVIQDTDAETNRRTENSGSVDFGGGVISGTGASASASGTGAASAVSIRGIGQNSGTELGRVDVGSVTQRTTSGTQVQQKGNISDLRTVSGAGASASLSATGAQTAVGVSRIGGTNDSTVTDIGQIFQDTDQSALAEIGGSTVNVTQSGNFTGSQDLDGGITGNGASVSASATGSVSSVSVSSINTTGASTVNIANGSEEGIVQRTTTTGQNENNQANVTNQPVTIDGNGSITGISSSASISATGAVSAVSVASINDGSAPTVRIGDVDQRTTNQIGSVSNGQGDAESVIDLGNISGTGASAAISASGAASAISVSNISSGGVGSTTIGRVDQVTLNTDADVTNAGSITVSSISGNNASASIGASGVTSALSKVDVNSAANVTTGNIAQKSVNSGSLVSNSGTVTAGNLSGNGASAGVSATGAASSVSVTTIK